LKSELPIYLSKCADTRESFCPLLWWKQNALKLPYWAEAANKTILLPPSSAASEHVFSLLKASFERTDQCFPRLFGSTTRAPAQLAFNFKSHQDIFSY